MKVGDRVRSTRYSGIFKVIESKIETTLDQNDKPVVRSTYLAVNEAKFTSLKFFGFDIDRTIFKVESMESEQLKLFD